MIVLGFSNCTIRYSAVKVVWDPEQDGKKKNASIFLYQRERRCNGHRNIDALIGSSKEEKRKEGNRGIRKDEEEEAEEYE